MFLARHWTFWNLISNRWMIHSKSSDVTWSSRMSHMSAWTKMSFRCGCKKSFNDMELSETENPCQFEVCYKDTSGRYIQLPETEKRHVNMTVCYKVLLNFSHNKTVGYRRNLQEKCYVWSKYLHINRIMNSSPQPWLKWSLKPPSSFWKVLCVPITKEYVTSTNHFPGNLHTIIWCI